MNDDEIKDLPMKELGRITREHLAQQVYKSIMEPPLLLGLLPNRPPLTRWQSFKSRIRWKIEDCRIWLSKRIYDWSSYEDE